MILRHRRMRPKNLYECVEIITTHPVIGPRYGRAIENLGPAEKENGRPRICGVQGEIMCDDDFSK